jgi:hypothetical protein
VLEGFEKRVLEDGVIPEYIFKAWRWGVILHTRELNCTAFSIPALRNVGSTT